MNPNRIYTVSGNRDGQRITTELLDGKGALHMVVEMRLSGYQLITMTDLETGHELDIERFLLGNPSAEQ